MVNNLKVSNFSSTSDAQNVNSTFSNISTANHNQIDSHEATHLINLTSLLFHPKEFKSENSNSIFTLITEILDIINSNALKRAISRLRINQKSAVTNSNAGRSVLIAAMYCPSSVDFIFHSTKYFYFFFW